MGQSISSYFSKPVKVEKDTSQQLQIQDSERVFSSLPQPQEKSQETSLLMMNKKSFTIKAGTFYSILDIPKVGIFDIYVQPESHEYAFAKFTIIRYKNNQWSVARTCSSSGINNSLDISMRGGELIIYNMGQIVINNDIKYNYSIVGIC